MCMPQTTKSCQKAPRTAMTIRIPMPPRSARPKRALAISVPISLPMGARTMKAMGMVTIMVQNGVKTVESTSGMTFLKNFSMK